MEDKKYIFKCPQTLKKFSIDFLSPINSRVAKLAAILTPTMKTEINVDREQDTLNMHPFIMNRNPFLIIWNVHGANNMAFRRNMRDLLNMHTPCMLALLEIKMKNHESLKNDYNFTGMFESLATGRSSGIVLLWHEDQVRITGVRQTFQELHVMVEVLTNNPTWLMSIV